MVIEVQAGAEREEQEEGGRSGAEEARAWKRLVRRLSATVL